MKAKLVSFTPDALNLLLSTKQTRLSATDDPPEKWTEEKKAEHLAYMLGTIKSSWEFVDYVFEITEVTRVFTHQAVRTRTGSYAQQAMRVVDASEFPVSVPATVAADSAAQGVWDAAVAAVRKAYRDLDEIGIPLQDARGILPNNVETAIMVKMNLRTLHETAKLRLCTRTQGEYQDVFRAMRAAVVDVHPWAAPFLQVHCVATGTCAFETYGKKECPVYLPEMDASAVKAQAHRKFWNLRYEAAPVARDGKAM